MHVRHIIYGLINGDKCSNWAADGGWVIHSFMERVGLGRIGCTNKQLAEGRCSTVNDGA